MSRSHDLILNLGSEEMHFKKIPSGKFWLGAYGKEPERFPLLRVELSSFYLMEVPVTQAVFFEVMNFNPSHFTGPEKPVTNVSYNEALMFCSKMESRIQGYHFRLPTEAEWEFAAKGRTAYKYAGSENLEEVGWYFKNSNNILQPVKCKIPNAFGLYDMSGNVWEWCSDSWRARYGYWGFPFKKAVKNPLYNTNGHNKVVRGGCFLFNDKVCEVVQRSRRVSTGKCSYVGFRIVACKS